MASKRKPKVTPKERAADLRLRRTYHLTLDEYNAIFAHQHFVCAICKQPVPEGKARLAVDHCHTTGLVRGLLCWKCNRALGVFRDNIELLVEAAKYLESPPTVGALMRTHYTAPGKIGSKKRAKLLKNWVLTQAAKSK